MLKLEESDCTILELATDDSLCREAQAIPVEGDGLVEVRDRQREY
jgi:hypothetical protein